MDAKTARGSAPAAETKTPKRISETIMAPVGIAIDSSFDRHRILRGRRAPATSTGEATMFGAA